MSFLPVSSTVQGYKGENLSSERYLLTTIFQFQFFISFEMTYMFKVLEIEQVVACDHMFCAYFWTLTNIFVPNPALKYSTAVPVIFLSALKYHVFPDVWISFYRPLWLISSVVNSLYSFYWDIKRDWDLRCRSLQKFLFYSVLAYPNCC